ncbi:MAG: MCP four helix bundle domain-containing protein [Thiotrichales bacterium]|nr:MAG: MCP four helix bundle domain-containing protein [Thiotrichales bacterium]
MTIKMRLWIMAVVAVVALAAVFLAGKLGLDSVQSQFNTVVDDRVPKMTQVQQLLIIALSTQRDVRELILMNDPDRREQIKKRMASYSEANTKNFELLEQSVRNEQGKALLAAAKSKRVAVREYIDKSIKLSELGDQQAAIEVITSVASRDAYFVYRDALQALFDYQIDLANQSAVSGKSAAESANTTMLAISLLAILILLAIALVVIRAVAGAVNQISSAVTNVASSMQFNTRLPLRNDELNAVSQSLNHMLTSLQNAVSDSNKVIGAIAAGDFSQRIQNHYVGDLDQLKQGINGSADNVASVMKHLEAAMVALKEGRFGVTVETNAPGSYGLMLSSVADSMKVLSLVVADINQIMQRLNDGNFDARVNANAQGDLLQMKQAVNGTLDTLEQLVDELVRMAKAQMEGDLTVVSQGTYKGRFKELQDARAASTARITEVVTLALQASHVVSDAASQVSQGSSDLSSRVQEQAAALEQTSATMHQMTSAVQANTENASKVAELAHQVQGQSNDGVQVMQQTIEAMKSIQQASNKIADIVSIIDSIAFQTNLLALNAAVEAARAGEHGRGFAVVASEVRALAGKSADAAKDIKGLIEDSVQRIDAGTKLADKSGEMLSTISESVKEVANMIEAISSASKEQTTGISQVHLAIADIDRVTQENAALVEETTAAAESLNHEANELRQNMSFFKTGQNNHSMARKAMPSAPAAKAAPSRQATQALPSPKASNGTDEWNEF